MQICKNAYYTERNIHLFVPSLKFIANWDTVSCPTKKKRKYNETHHHLTLIGNNLYIEYIHIKRKRYFVS